MVPGSLRDRWRSVLRQKPHERSEQEEAGNADAEPAAEAGIGEELPSPEVPPPASDRPEITEEVMKEYWLRHVRKLIDAGIPLQRVARSLRNASVQVDDDWFRWATDNARERIDALGPSHRAADLARSLARSPAEDHDNREAEATGGIS